MSQPALHDVLEILNGKLSDTARAALIQVARDIAGGYEGEIKIIVGTGGGVRFVEWTRRADGATIKAGIS